MQQETTGERHLKNEHGDNRAAIVVIDGKPYECDHRDIDGLRVLQIRGRHPIDEFLVYALRQDGVLEDLSLDEKVKIRDVKEFRTYKSDRSFRFQLEGVRQDWGASNIINEPTLLKLAGAGNEYRVSMERTGKPDRMLNRGEEVVLSEEGIERFRIQKGNPDEGCDQGPKLVTITINSKPYELQPGNHSVAELRSIGHVPPDETLNIFENGEFKPLGENQHIKVKGGEQFASSAMSGGAS